MVALAPKLQQLFVNRHDTYALQRKDGRYLRIEEPLTLDVLRLHLEGKVTVGAYQLNADNKVKTLVFDIDPEHVQDPKTAAKKIVEECIRKPDPKQPRFYKGNVLLEPSRHPDPSYHIWILFCPELDARFARWLGNKILEHANLSPKKIEVFPKQDKIEKGGFGNFVKLPLGLHQVERKWSKILDFDSMEVLDNTVLLGKYGCSFSLRDEQKLAKLTNKKQAVQMSLTLRGKFRALSNREEEKTAKWLTKYWVPGYRNQLELYFLGLCLKKGVSHGSAKRIIAAVVDRTNDEEKTARLALVDYHYRNRANITLKGKSGIRELLGVLRREHQQRT